jgi:hypothetical protein
MSKVGQWVFEMQEDAQWCSRDVFIRKHGLSQVVVWDEVQRQMEQDEPYFEMEMDDGA